MGLMSPLLYFVLLTLSGAFAIGFIKEYNEIVTEKGSLPSAAWLELDKRHVHKKVLNDFRNHASSDLKIAFTDPQCKKCMKCMEKAILGHKVHSHITFAKSSINDIQTDDFFDEPGTEHREKRESVGTPKKKKSKSSHRSTNVIKYTRDNEIYALKVKESSDTDTKAAHGGTCHVYRVKAAYACHSTEGQNILNMAERKSKKLGKKNVKKNSVTSEKISVTPTQGTVPPTAEITTAAATETETTPAAAVELVQFLHS